MKSKLLSYQLMEACHRCMVTTLVTLFVSLSTHAVASDRVTPDSIAETRGKSETYSRDSIFTFTEKILFPKASAVVSRNFADNQAHIDSICSFLSKADTGNFLSVRIVGSYSPEGKFSFNTKLAKARALALADIIKGYKVVVDPVTSIIPPYKHVQYRKQDYSGQRFAELQVVCQNPKDSVITDDTDSLSVAELPQPDDIQTASELQLESDSSEHVVVSDSCDTVSLPQVRNNVFSRIFVYTNLLYDAALTPNIGVGVSVTDRLTVLADWMFARWSNHDKRRYWRIYGGDVEVRYRIGKNKVGSPLGGHHIGAYGSIACYDFQTGRTHKGVLSDKYNYAVGLSYTYALPVTTHLNIDFSLGVGYLWGTYKKHIPMDDCDVWLSTHKMGWFGPTKVGVSLVWLIGNGVSNKRKGGNR